MRKTILIPLMALLIASSCKNSHRSEGDIEITASNIQVSGDLENIIKVIDGPCKVTKTSSDLVFTLKVQVTGKIDDDKEFEELRAEFKDAQNMPIASISDFYIAKGLWSTSNDVEKMQYALSKGSGEVDLRLVCAGVISDEKQSKTMDEIREKVKSFTITTKASKKVANTGSISNQSSSTVSTGNDQDWDKILNDYEDFVSQYLVIVRKAQKSDMSAMNEATEFLEKADRLDEELKKAQNDNSLSSDQMSRLIKIEAKLLAASADMLNK